MSNKLFYLVSFVLVLALAGTNAAFGDFSLDVRVAATNDDAEEKVAAGGVELGSSDLELGHEGVASPENLQIVAVRFTGVGIPKGVTISKAWVQFTADDINDDYHIPPVSVIIEGELGPNPVEFTSTARDISSRATTTASEVWDIPLWSTVLSAGPDERTPDISPVIQEIIDQDGWAAGNAMVVILKDNPDNPSQGTREAEAFDGDPSTAPLLHIEYAVKYATEPNPADGGTGGPAPLMQWTKGDTAVYHDVYFGTNPDLGPADYMDRWTWAMYWHVPLLTPGVTYYWRIDEVEADGTTIHTGDLWSFTAVGFTAHSPDPPDGNKTTLPDAVLSWGAGSSAATNDVYFGTSKADVAAGTGDTFKGNQMDGTYDPKGLQNGTTYYWRIDEVEANGTTKHPGEVWSFRTFDDPAFIGWWKFDEGQGNIAFDSSGYGNHGILGGNPQWVGGAIDGGLELDGSDDYVSIDCIAPMVTSNNFSCSIWIKTDTTVDDHVVFGSNSDSSHNFLFGVNNGNVWTDDDTDTEFPPSVADNRWHMITYVREELTSWIYVDGVLRKEDPTDDEPAMDMQWSIGQEWDSSPSDEFEGVVDDARFWIRPLTAEEVAEVFKGDVDLAHSPKPAYGSTPDIRDATPLSWSPGEKAAQHDVYFGTDELSVQGLDASDTTGMYRGRQIATSYTPTEVEFGGGPYYWRIDEYNTDGTISEGKLWNFTVADYLIVDDFESYNDLNPTDPESNRIFNTWIDGWDNPTINGSVVGYANFPFTEQTIVHSGRQSMPYSYDTNFKYSEANLPLSSRRDWTEQGVGVLSLWFRGNPAGFVEDPADTYTMTGAGADIWNDADEFRYAYKQLSGAGTIVAQVLSVENTNVWAKAGVMIRESLDPGSKFAAVYITPGNGCRFQARLLSGIDAISDSGVTTLANIEAPHWIKLERDAAGNFNAYNSDNGVTWTPLAWNPQSISMATNVYIGLALTSHNSGVTCVAEFSDVETTGAITPLTWTHEAIGATMAANDPAPMYVALNGGTAVYHGNLNAPLIDTWTEWTIDLQDFIGVNLTNVNMLAIGFGDKNNLQPGGSGLVYFDDIRLYRPAEPQP